MDDRYPEILADLAARVAEVLATEGQLARPEAHRLARLIADRVGRDWAGQQIYIGRGLVISERDREIVCRFTGNNHAELASRYGLTERQIYNIVARARSEACRKNQIPLFADPA